MPTGSAKLLRIIRELKKVREETKTYSKKVRLRCFVAKITGRTCDKCKYGVDEITCSNAGRFFRCVNSLYSRGFEPKEREGGD